MSTLACWIFSEKGFALAKQLQSLLPANPWLHGRDVFSTIDFFVPERFLREETSVPWEERPLCSNRVKEQDTLHAKTDEDTFSSQGQTILVPFKSSASLFAERFHAYKAHIVIGATGIAVRLLAPNITHKCKDPAVVVLNATGSFVISLLSGHLGGANDLTRHLAKLLSATPVITTASEEECCPSIDLLAKEAGLSILDWQNLPRFQALLLSHSPLYLYDPFGFFQEFKHSSITRLEKITENDSRPLILIDWQAHSAQENHLRLCIPHLVLGIGCKKNIDADIVEQSFWTFLSENLLAEKSILALATIHEKKTENAFIKLADSLGVPLLTFSAADLSAVVTPNPSEKAAQQFATKPFSVSEGAALLGAMQMYTEAFLLCPKKSYFRSVTLACAGATSFVRARPSSLQSDSVQTILP